jgi:hypothetical protein
LVPSADEATETQFVLGALVCVQAAPEFVEVKIPPAFTTATNLLPSADEAIDDHVAMGALVNFQSWAKAGLAAVYRTPSAATASSQCFAFINC